jgi:prepilin-type N-terminal cleavage/methylation domain-containing protein
MNSNYSHANRSNCGIGDRAGRQGGFTMIEVLVAMGILTVIMAGMLTFLLGMSRNWQSNQDAVDALDNARIGLNRMTRELRQSTNVTAATAESVTFMVDFGDGTETITLRYQEGDGTEPGQVWRESSAAAGDSILIDRVDDALFEFYGSDYRCDSSGDGIVTYAELQSCDASPEALVARVDITLYLDSGDSIREFVGQAWLRNRTIS